MGQRSIDQICEDGLDDSVATVGDVRVDSGLCRVGEERVIPPDREQFVLTAASRTRRTISRAVMRSLVEAKAV